MVEDANNTENRDTILSSFIMIRPAQAEYSPLLHTEAQWAHLQQDYTTRRRYLQEKNRIIQCEAGPEG
jgi:hypothetical protein